MSKPKSEGNPKADFTVKLVLMFFISLLSFSVGTYLGKQVSDADYQRMSREAEYNSTETTHSKATDETATEPIKDEDVASLTEEFLTASRKTASEETAPAEPPPAHSATAEEGYSHHSKINANHKEDAVNAASTTTTPHTQSSPEHGVPKAAHRVGSGLAPTADPAKKRAPTTALPAVATTAVGKYTVQVSSYATQSEAGAFAEKLLGQGYPAFVVTADVSGKTWYRVSIGRFPDQDAAKTYRTELLSSQAVPTAIVQKIIK